MYVGAKRVKCYRCRQEMRYDQAYFAPTILERKIDGGYFLCSRAPVCLYCKIAIETIWDNELSKPIDGAKELKFWRER